MSIPSQGADAPVTSILIQKPTATPGPKEAALREQRGTEASVTVATTATEKPADASSAPAGDKAPADDNLAIPAFLDRVQGRSKKEMPWREWVAKSPRSDTNLTEKDKQVIKQMKADAKKQAKLSERAARKLRKDKAAAERRAKTPKVAKVAKVAKKTAVSLKELGDTPQGKANAASWDAVTKTKAKKSGSKTDLIAEMLKRSGGCTAAEVLKATGWPTVSMPAQANAAGLKLRKEKVAGSPTRYFGS